MYIFKSTVFFVITHEVFHLNINTSCLYVHVCCDFCIAVNFCIVKKISTVTNVHKVIIIIVNMHYVLTLCIKKYKLLIVKGQYWLSCFMII